MINENDLNIELYLGKRDYVKAKELVLEDLDDVLLPAEIKNMRIKQLIDLLIKTHSYNEALRTAQNYKNTAVNQGLIATLTVQSIGCLTVLEREDEALIEAKTAFEAKIISEQSYDMIVSQIIDSFATPKERTNNNNDLRMN